MPSDGVTGYSLFGDYTVEVDDDEMMITLHDPQKFVPPPDRRWIPMTFQDNSIPWVDATADILGHEVISLSMYVDLASGDAV